MIKFTAVMGVLVVGLLIFCGLYLLFKGARNVQRAIASAKWPRTNGTVVTSETTRSVSVDTRKRESSVTFSTKTIVRYQAAGREYTTDVLHFGQTLGSDDKSEAVLQRLRYPAGKTVGVSYDPRQPWIGVLKPGLHAEAFWLPGASLALLIPAFLCLLIGPGILRTIATPDTAFQDSVEHAIEDARRGVRPADVPFPSPPQQGSDWVMAVVAGVFGMVACGLGILALASGMERIWRGNASLSWPTAPGVVIAAPKTSGPDGGEVVNDTTDTAWYARFVYQYKVAGVDHFNNVRRFARVEGGGGSEEVDRLISRYGEGAHVKVSYFPTDPDIAVLEPGTPTDALWLPGIGMVLILLSAAIFLFIVPALAKS
jgi:hypothetical protein